MSQWPSGDHTVHTLSVMLALKPASSSLLLHTPEAISYRWRKRGVPLCKWVQWGKSTAASVSQAHSHISYINKEEEYVWKTSGQRGSHHWVPPVVCRVPAKNLTEHWVGGIVCWQGLSLCLSLSLPLSELRPGYSWAFSVVLQEIANPATLIEHWKQEFYKGADLLFITSHSLLFLPHSSVFHWLTVPHSSFRFVGPFLPRSPVHARTPSHPGAPL